MRGKWDLMSRFAGIGLILFFINMEAGAVIDAADYLIDEDNGTYRATSGVNGQVYSSDTNAAKVINAAINALGSEGGSIALTSGIYPVKSLITLHSDVAIYGRSGAILKLQYNGDMLAGKGVSGVVLKGFELDGNGAQYTGRGILLSEGSQHNLISGLYVHDCKEDGINFDGATTGYNRVVGNRIENCEGGAGIALYSSATETIISENYIYRTRHHGIILSRGGSNCQIVKNKIIEAGYYRQQGDFSHGIAVDAYGEEPTGKNNMIIGNIIIDSYEAGIEVADIQDFCVISNNIVENPNSYGIYFGGGLAASSNATIVGNIVKGAADSGIRVGSPYGDAKITVNVTIGNNFVSDSTQHGIHLHTVGHVNISDNICLNNNNNGIYVSGESEQLLTSWINIVGNQSYDNRIPKIQQYGLYLRNASYVTVMGNLLSGNKTGNIYRSNVTHYLEDNNQ